MKPRLVVFTLVAALLALGTIAACGGSSDLSLEEYFQQIEAVAEELEQRSEALDDELQESFVRAPSEEEAVEAFREFVAQFTVLLGVFASGLADIDPPPQAEAAHNEAVDALRGAEAQWQDLVGRLQDIDSEIELLQTLTDADPELSAAIDRVGETCSALQALADENDIDADLKCGGE